MNKMYFPQTLQDEINNAYTNNPRRAQISGMRIYTKGGYALESNESYPETLSTVRDLDGEPLKSTTLYNSKHLYLVVN